MLHILAAILAASLITASLASSRPASYDQTYGVRGATTQSAVSSGFLHNVARGFERVWERLRPAQPLVNPATEDIILTGIPPEAIQTIEGPAGSGTAINIFHDATAARIGTVRGSKSDIAINPDGGQVYVAGDLAVSSVLAGLTYEGEIWAQNLNLNGNRLGGDTLSVSSSSGEEILTVNDNSVTINVPVNAPNIGDGEAGAGTDAPYVVVAADPTLTSERVFTAGSNIAVSDTGPNGTLIVAVATDPTFGNVTASEFTGSGAGLTNIQDSALTSNVALLNRNNQTFTGSNTFSASGVGLTVTNTASIGTLDVAGLIQAGSGNVTITTAAGNLDADTLGLITGDGTGATSSGSGLEVDTDRLGLLQGCGDGQILKWVDGTNLWNCAPDAVGASATLQAAYDAGNTISTSNARDISLTLADFGTDSNLVVTTAANSTGQTRFVLSGGGAALPTELVLIESQHATTALANGLSIQAAGGGITDAIDVSDAELVNAINIGSNDILSGGVSISSAELNLLDGHDVALVDTNDAVTTAIIGTGALNSGSITSGFGAIDVGTDAITTSGTITGGTINATTALQSGGTTRIDSSGNLVNIGNLTAAAAITIASTGAGNDIILNSADTIELQDNTNITGDLDVSGTLAVGTGNAFQVDGSGNVTSGTINGQTITSAASFTGTVALATLGAAGSTAVCRNGSNQLATCSSNPGGVTLQQAYDAGNIIDTSDNRDIDIVLADDTTDSNLDIDIQADNTVSISRLDSTISEAPAQLLLLENLDDNLTISDGLLVNVVTGGVVTDGVDVSDADIDNALNVGANDIVGTTPTIDFTNIDIAGDGSFTWAVNSATDGIFNLSSTGDFIVQDAGTARLTVGDDGSYTYALPAGTVDYNISGLDADSNLILSGLNCTGNINGGALTTNASGVVSCSDDDSGVGSVSWSSLIAPTANLSLNHSAFTTTFDWTATGALNPWTMTLNNNSATANTQNFVRLINAATSQVTDVNTEALLVLDNADTTTLGSTVVDNAIQITASGNVSNAITDALDVSDADIVNAINLGDNTILGTGAVINFSDFDVASTGQVTISDTTDITTPSGEDLTLLAGGAGVIDLNDTVRIPTLDGTAGATSLCRNASNFLAGCSGSGGSDPSVTLQNAYVNGNTITTTDADNSITFNLADTTDDEDFLVDIQGTGNTFEIQDGGTAFVTFADGGLSTFLDDVNLTFAGTENLAATSDLAGAVDILSIIGTPSSTAASTRGILLEQASSANTNGIDTGIEINNADDSVAIGTGLLIQSTGGGAITTALDVSDSDIGTSLSFGANDISGTNFTVTGSSGNVDTAGTIQAGSSNVTLTLSTGFIDADALTLTTSGGAGAAFSNSGLEVVSDGLTLLKGCTDGQVLKWDDVTDVRWECAADSAGGTVTLQTAYDNGSVINTSDARDIDFELADDTTDSNFDIDIFADNTVSISRNATASAESPAQLLLLENLDTDITITDGILFNVANPGAITDAIDLTDTDIVNALNVGDNTILGTTGVINFSNFDVASTGQLTFTGVGTDITTASGEDLTLQAAGAGVIQLSDAVTASGTITISGVTSDITTASGEDLSLSGAGAGVVELNDTVRIPTLDGTAGATALCRNASNLLAGCGSNPSGVTLQQAYEAGNTISTTEADGDIAFTLADTTTDRSFTISVASNATGSVQITRPDAGTGESAPAQFLLIDNLDTDVAVGNGITIQAAAGGITDGLDASDAEITNALNAGDNVILGTTTTIDFTNFDVTSAGAVTAGSTVTGTTLNATTGTIQTNSTNRIDNSGNLVNIGNITGTGAITIASSGAGNDIIVNGADIFDVQDATTFASTATFNGVATFNTDVDLTLAETENLSVTNTVTSTNAVDLVSVVLTNNSTSGTQRVGVLQNAAGSGVTEALLLLDNADTDTAVTAGLQITSAAGLITTALDASDAEIGTALAIGANDISTSAGNGTSVNCAPTEFLQDPQLQAGIVVAGTCATAGGSGTLQDAYVAGNTITTTDVDNSIIFNLADTTDDEDFIVDIQGTGNTFEIQDGGVSFVTFADGGLSTFLDDVDLTFAGAENLRGTSSVTTDTAVNVGEIILTHNIADTTTQRVLLLQNADDGAAAAGTIERLLVLDNADANEAVTTALEVSAAAGTIGTAIDLSDGDIGTGISLGGNDITGTSAVINFSDFDVASTGQVTVSDTTDITTPSGEDLTLQGAGAGVVDLNDTVRIPTLDGTAGATALCRNASNLLATCSGSGGSDPSVTLQNAYVNGNTITTTDADNGIVFNLADTTDDEDFIVDIQGTGNTVEIQDGGATFVSFADGGLSTFSDDVNGTFAGTENLALTSDLAGAVDVVSIIGTPSATAATTRGIFIQQASSANTNGIDTAIEIDNADDGLAIGTGILIQGSSTANVTTAIDISDAQVGTGISLGANDITGTTAVINFDNFDLAGDGSFTWAVNSATNGIFNLASTGDFVIQAAGVNRLTIADDSSFTYALPSGTVDLTVSGLDADSQVIFSGLNSCDTIDTTAGGALICGTDSGGGGAALDTLTAATADDAAILSGDNTIIWEWALTSATSKAFTIGESSASTGGSGNQHLLLLTTDSGSTAGPLEVVSNSADSGDIEINLNSSGDFEIQDAGTAFATFADNGTVLYNHGASATAFRIQESVGGVALFTADTETATDPLRIAFGDTSTANAPVLVVLDQEDADPTGANGAMYYQTATNKFRCFQASAWTDCIGAGGPGGGVSLSPSTPDTFGADNDPGIWLNENGSSTTASLLRLDQGGVARFLVGNHGGLTINAATTNVVRTTTADFALGTLTNLTNTNDQIELSDGTVPNSGNGTITTAGQPTTSAAIGAGAHGILRADGQYLVIRGGGTGIDRYDSIANTFTNHTQTLTAAAGAGSLAVPRPENRYLVVHGGGVNTTTLLDPMGVVAAAAGPTLSATATTGTVAAKRPDGRFLIAHGGAGTTSVYDPVANTNATGPAAASGTWGAGSLALPRPGNGQVLVVNGGATATTNLYNYNTGTGNVGVFAAGPVLPAGCEINGAGSVAIRKPNGTYIVMSKINVSAIYDPVANTWSQNQGSCTTPAAGKGPTVALADGAHAIPMQNGKFLILIGGASTVANIYDPSTDTFSAHGTAVTAGGAGRHSIMRAGGTWQMLNGGGTGTNNFDTGLPMTGSYVSDDISTTSLNATSILRWTAMMESAFTGTNAATNTAFTPMQFKVRTAVNSGGCTTPLNSASDRELRDSGDLIRPGSTDNCIRLTVNYNRPIPDRVIDERGTWTGNSSTVTRLDYVTPTLFDIAIDNSVALHRNNFDFSFPNAQSAAPQNETSGPLNTRVEALPDRVFLPHGRIVPTTQVGTGSGFYQGAFSAAHEALTQTTNNDTVVITRPDKRFIVIAAAGATSTNTMMYDPATADFVAQTGSSATTAVTGIGAHAIKRPDGKFLVVLGNGTTTNIYDPTANTFVAGPALIAAAGAGASSMLNTDGTYTIVHGGAATTSSIYDPVRNTIITGPTLTTAANCGFWAIPLNPPHNISYKVFPGIATGVIGATTAMNYDARNKIFTNNTAFPLVGAHGCGSFVFQRQDGWWVSVAAAGGTAGASSTVTALHNPFNGVSLAGPALSAAAGQGAHVIPRADGTFLIIHGHAATTTSIYFPWGTPASAIGSNIAGPATATAVGALGSRGALSFQRPDGKFITIVGGAGVATTNIYDAGWYADGQYLSEQVQVPALAANSTLVWRQTPDNFVRMEVRVASSQAALGTTAYSTVGRSGQSIANAGGETWVQVQVNFRRDFPGGYCRNLTDVLVSSGNMSYCYRNIAVPTLFEYRLTNGNDLLNLQADGVSILRATTDGGIYSSEMGGFFAGGADLAERYTSTDALEPGEVVIGDPNNPQGVLRSGGQYQSIVLGVVSTAPGFVAGAYTEDSYPIALVGRVPVKVSTENGPIYANDPLTSASIPGYAMKATRAGRIIGRALEPLRTEQLGPCPPVALGTNVKTKCGTVMMFVNLVDYLGTSVEVVMAEHAASDQSTENGADLGLELPEQGRTALLSSPMIFLPGEMSHEEEILAFLRELKESRETVAGRSEVFTDRVSAVEEVISPQIITDLLVAKTIKADRIEGLEILIDREQRAATPAVAGLTREGATSLGSSGSTTPLTPTAPGTVIPLEKVEFTDGEKTLDWVVLGRLEAKGGLTVAGVVEFQDGVTFHSLAEFVAEVIIKGDLRLLGRPTFNADTAGFAHVKRGVKEVEVRFEKEHTETPVVTITLEEPILSDADVRRYRDEGTCPDPVTLEECQEKVAEAILAADLRFVVVKKGPQGFTIRLNKPTPDDLFFSWTALAVDRPRVSESANPPPPAPPPPAEPNP